MTDEFAVEREGLWAALALGTWAYFVLLLSHLWVQVAWQVWLNRVSSLTFFLWVYRRFWDGRIRPEQITRWTFVLTLLVSTSVFTSYIYGAGPYVAVRYGFLMIVTAVLGLPRLTHLMLMLLGIALTAYLQIRYPSASDPGLNLLPTLVSAVFSLQAHRARRDIFSSLAQARQKLSSQAAQLEESHKQALHLQQTLDFEVSRATGHLEETNQRLQAAIEDQVQSFHRNQQLRQDTADLLCSQSLGRAAGAAAHDFNNLLAVISGTLELHEQDFRRDPESSAAYETMRGEVDRAMVVGRRVLAVSGRQILRPETICLDRILPIWVAEWVEKYPGLRLLSEATDITTRCDPTELQRILEALIRNAAEATSADSTILLRLLPERQLLVEDQGTPPPEAVCSQFFRPFFTTRPDHEHLGLSLAASRALLRQQGGEIDYQGHFRIHLP